MKKAQLILLATFLFTFYYSNAQTDTLTIRLDSITGVIVNGQEITHEFQFSSGPIDPIHYNFHIINNNGSDKDWMITRKIISQPNSWSNYLCWEGLCYPPNPLNTWNSNIGNLASGDTSVLSVYINTPSIGTSHYRYYISNDGIDFVDSVDVVITSFLDVNQDDNISYNLFPNPASNEFKISLSSLNKTEIRIYSMSGRLVLNKTLTQMENINISHLENGSYIYILKDLETGILIKDKLIVNK